MISLKQTDKKRIKIDKVADYYDLFISMLQVDTSVLP